MPELQHSSDAAHLAVPYRPNGNILPLIFAIFLIIFFVVGLTTLNKRSAKGFASNAEVQRLQRLMQLQLLYPSWEYLK